MKEFDFGKMSPILMKTDKEAAQKLTDEQRQTIEKRAEKIVILKCQVFLKTIKPIINQHRKKISKLNKEIKSWKEYQANKEIIKRYAKICECRYLIKELLKVGRFDRKRIKRRRQKREHRTDS